MNKREGGDFVTDSKRKAHKMVITTFYLWEWAEFVQLVQTMFKFLKNALRNTSQLVSHDPAVAYTNLHDDKLQSFINLFSKCFVYTSILLSHWEK